jgi:ATP-dependent DNA helicase PIF1
MNYLLVKMEKFFKPKNSGILNKQQQEIADKILNGKINCFITGSGGCGKSFLLKYLIKKFSIKYKSDEIGVTAMTGIAAVSINGKTLHSFAGMGYKGENKPNFVAKRRWYKTKVLIIDEVSMLTKDFLDRLYPHMKYLQLIVCGDFHQLPPINGEFCFKSDVWDILNLRKNTFILTEIMRQSDVNFIKALNDIRVGSITDETVEYLKKLNISKKKDTVTDNHTKLYTVNYNVDKENNKRLKQLETQLKVIKAQDTIKYKNKGSKNKNLLETCTKLIEKEAATEIELKVGAQIILTRNQVGGLLVNGSRGVVSDFINDLPKIKFQNGMEEVIKRVEYEIECKGIKIVRLQIPVKLSYSLTAHRAQSLSLPYLLVNFENSFENGQCYTALSRAVTPENTVIDNVRSLLSFNKVSKDALDYYKSVEIK